MLRPKPTTFLSVDPVALALYRNTPPRGDTENGLLELLEECAARAPIEETTFYLAMVVAVDEGRIEMDDEPWMTYCFYRHRWRRNNVLQERVPAFFAIGYDKGEAE